MLYQEEYSILNLVQLIECNNCTFVNNFAIRGGVAFMNSNGLIKLYNSSISGNNYA